MTKLTGIILAGGKSSRIGKEKSLLKLGNKTLLQHAIKILEPICDRILISSNSKLLGRIDHEVLPDEIRDIGPMGGIYTCLKSSLTETNLILSVDAPFVSQDLFVHLLKYSKNNDVVVPKHKSVVYPLIGVYQKSFLKILHEDIKNKHYKMLFAIRKAKHSMVNIDKNTEFNNEMIFLNINTVDDLKTAENYLSLRS